MEASQRNLWLFAAALTLVAAILWLTMSKIALGVIFAVVTVLFVAAALREPRVGGTPRSRVP